ncbi:WD domain, G-beta repeat protein [Toxoplasma gondii GAB2-2007-GAL-DOM2]|uniref:WD domain, G-beta repeat protein n=1 Tax=Toxoplasma gondii GAB2-2007-GAL-DOM2 TaxID=1130820 RepID=A0A086KAW3_TOXGO|nr:WD domain, G-beta repeat protein [Toxoplasma gondii GAB2-2007-GAL-DOM2]
MKLVSLPFVTVFPLSDDDNLFASASADTAILIWDATRMAPVHALKGHRKSVSSLAFSANYSCLLSAGLDKDALVWSQCNMNKAICHLQGHPYALCGVAVVPNTPQVLTADASGAIRVWDLRNFRSLQTISSLCM